MDALNSGQLYSVNVAPHTECEEEQHNLYYTLGIALSPQQLHSGGTTKPLLVDALNNG